MSQPSNPRNFASQARNIFVGRHEELTSLESALDELLQGGSSTVALVGEAGIGKTRIVDRFAGMAESRGAQVLISRCYEGQGAPPFWPWVQLIRSYIEKQPPESLRTVMGSGAADIAELIPSIAEILPGLPVPTVLEPEQARFRLFDSICTLFKSAAKAQPMVIVIDDLHWADQSSLLLLEFLVRQISGINLLVIITYRDVEVTQSHPLYRVMGSLIQEQSFQRIRLGGLSIPDLRQFIEELTGSPSQPRLAEAMHARTGGNPLFVGEVARLLLQEQSPSSNTWPEGASWTSKVPEGLREVIGRRLGQLTEGSEEILIVASLLGRETTVDRLGALVPEFAELKLLEILDGASSSGLIEEEPGTIDGYRFTHALIQETVASGISSARRSRIHARIAGLLEETYRDDLEAHATVLAHHLLQAPTSTHANEAIRYSILAGEKAISSFAYQEALTFFQEALKLAELHTDQADQKGQILFGLGRAQAATLESDELQQAYDTLNSAFDAFEQAGDVDQAIAVAEYELLPMLPGLTGVTKLVNRALELVDTDSLRAGRLYARNIVGLYMEEFDLEGADLSFQNAQAIALRNQDSELEAHALVNSAHISAFQAQWPDVLTKCQRALDLRSESSDSRMLMAAEDWVCEALTYLGRGAEALPHARAFLDFAESFRDRFFLAQALAANAFIFRLEGKWQQARGLTTRALDVWPNDPVLLALSAAVEFEVGAFSEGGRFLTQLMEPERLENPAPPWEYAVRSILIPTLTRITGEEDRFPEARDAAQALLSPMPAPSMFSDLARGGLALMAAHGRDSVAAEEQYASLLSCRNSMLWTGIASGDRLLGRLAVTMGLMDDAENHFQEAMDFCRTAGYRPEYAWSAYECADGLIRRGRAADRAKAIGLLEEAESVALELGMSPLAERSAELREQIPGGTATKALYPDGLTEREVDVLRLIAAGKTDREIGEELYISTRTVGAHVGHILSKTLAANRTEAAVYATHHGLAELSEDP